MLWLLGLMEGAFLFLYALGDLPLFGGMFAQMVLWDLSLYVMVCFSGAGIVRVFRSFCAARAERGAGVSSLDSAALRVARRGGLSPRETQVFVLLSEGVAVGEIAGR